MKKLNFSVSVDAPKEKVWETMLQDSTYREWTKVFNPKGSSYYKGDWSKGSKMLFLGPDPDTGEEGGMVSRVVENIPYEFISIEHLGIIHNGEEDISSPEAKEWSPAIESYALKEQNGVTEVVVDLDMKEEYLKMFKDAWPKALQKLKEIAEK